MFYDPRQDIAGGVDGAGYGPGDRAWVEAALAVYDLFRQIGGEAPSRRYLFKRGAGGVFVGVEGGAGHWHDTVGHGQAAFLRLLVRDSQALPDRLRLAALRQDDGALGAMVDDITTTVSAPGGVLLIAPGATGILRFVGAGHAIGTSGLSVSTRPDGKGGLTVAVARAPGGTTRPQAVLAFPDGRHFTPSETVEVASLADAAAGGGTKTGPTDPVAEAARPDRLDVSNGTPVLDRIIDSGETRQYTVSITTGGVYEFLSEGPSDVLAQLKAPDGSVLARNDDGGAGYNFKLEATLQPGDYTLEVGHCCAGTGPFSLSLLPR